jgi:hypothetical protein
MSTVTHKLQLALCLTSAAIIVPKTAYSQTAGNVSDMDSVGKSKSPSIPQANETTTVLQDVPVAISQPESFADLPQLGGYETGVNLDWQVRVEDLFSKNNNIKPCVPSNIGQPEFTKVVALVAKNKNRESCISTNIGQPEFSSSGLKKQLGVGELEKKQISPNSSSSGNFNLVAELEKKPNTEKSPENLIKDPKYITPPKVIPDKNVAPFTTTLLLNGKRISHLTKGELAGSVNFGDGVNTSFDINGILKLNGNISTSLSRNNIITREQRGSYIQLQMVNKKREVSVITKQPQTLIGIDLQLSLIGSCILPGTNPNDLCAFLPGITTDRNSINPDLQIPTRIFQSSPFGEVIKPETLTAIQQPGFQKKVNGQEIGVDLYLPNTGSTFGNTQSDTASVIRKETIENTPTGFLSTVRQVLKANDREAFIGRTVRGYGFILNDENSLVNSGLQAANLFLPDAVPQITGGDKAVNMNINNNLFFAVNNARLPNNSFTIYHAGIGRGKSPQASQNKPQSPSAAHFNSVWLGVSPVRKSSIFGKSTYEILSDPRIIRSASGEGGSDANLDVVSVINDQVFSPANLDNAYTQVSLDLFNRDVNQVSNSKFSSITNYYPHLSFTGNITGSEDVFRYYGGVIAEKNLNAYVGADFTRNSLSGWTYSLGAIAYTHPDSDYYSQVQGSISKRISFNRNAILLLSTGFNYALDGDTRVNGNLIKNSASSVSLGATAQLGSVSLGLTNYFGNILPNSIDNSLFLNLGYKFSNNFQVSVFYNPINESSSRTLYGVNAVFKLGNSQKSPTLVMSWNRKEYGFGIDPKGNQLDITNNVFTILLRGDL